MRKYGNSNVRCQSEFSRRDKNLVYKIAKAFLFAKLVLHEKVSWVNKKHPATLWKTLGVVIYKKSCGEPLYLLSMQRMQEICFVKPRNFFLPKFGK